MINIGNNFITIETKWTEFKSISIAKKLPIQYIINSTGYYLFCIDNPIVYVTDLWVGTIPNPDPNYSQDQNDTDKLDFETNYKSKCNKSLQEKTADGRTVNAVGKSDATKVNFYTHDWTDPTTWAESSIRVVNEIATDDGYHTTYSIAHQNIIDNYHGKTIQEDYLLDKDGYSLRIAVKVNDITKTEQDPHYGTGGHFTVNYDLGKITFLTTLEETDVVKVTYHYATNSTFTIKPAAGKAIRMEMVEVQFAEDIEITDTITFQAYGLVDYFAPQYIPGIPSGTKIPLGQPIVYKTISDFQSEAVKGYPKFPVMSVNTWRGSPKAILILNWDYLASTVLKSSMGMEIRIKLQHDTPYQGWYATCTCYNLSFTE